MDRSIKTTVVGSYPVPTWLRVVSNRESLQDAVAAVIKTQEIAGIDIVSDGELCRWNVNHAETNGMIEYFVRPMDGIHCDLTFEELTQWKEKEQLRFRVAPPGIVTGPIGSGYLNLRKDYELYRQMTTLPKKFTVTSPYMLAKTLANKNYRDLEALVMAIAEVLKRQITDIDADVIQVDEAHLTGNPQDATIAAAGINKVLEGVQREKAVHLCFGNYGGQTIQTGTYRALLGFMNSLQADHLVLELTRRSTIELEMLAEVDPRMNFGIGVIDIKDNEVETPEKVASRLERAATILGVERIKYAHPDCGFWMLPRSVADQKMRSLVAGRNQFLNQQREAATAAPHFDTRRTNQTQAAFNRL